MNREKTEKEINECAMYYCRYKNDPTNRGQAMHFKNRLAAYYYTGEYSSYIKNKARRDFDKYGINENIESFDTVITDVLLKAIKDYDYERNDNFVSYFFQNYNFKIKDTLKRLRKEMNIRITECCSSDDEGNSVEKTIADLPVDDNSDIQIRIEFPDKLLKVLSMVSRFKEHNHGKAANEKRFYYHSLFTTDRSVSLLKEFPEISDSVNENEFFNSVNIDFLDYFMSDECFDISEIISCKLKTYGQIAEKYSAEEENQEAGQPLKPTIYIKYIYSDRGEKVTDSALSQQKTSFDDMLRKYISQ